MQLGIVLRLASQPREVREGRVDEFAARVERARQPGDGVVYVEDERVGQAANTLEVALGKDAFATGLHALVGGQPKNGHERQIGDQCHRERAAMAQHEAPRAIAPGASPRLHGQTFEVPEQVFRHRLGGGVAVCRILAQRHHHDGVEIAAQPPAHALGLGRGRRRAGQHRFGVADGARQLVGAVDRRRRIRARVGQQAIQDDAQRIDVARRRDLAAAHLLGARVDQCHRALGGGRPSDRLRRAGVDALGDAEVHQLDHAVVPHEDVVGLQVAVHDALLVRVVHHLADAAEQPHAVVDGQPPPRHVDVDRLAIDQLHHDVGRTVLRDAAVQHLGEIGMVEAREDLALRLEAHGEPLGIEAVAHDLDGDLLRELAVDAFGTVDLAHAAAADARDDAPRAQAAPDPVAAGGQRLVGDPHRRQRVHAAVGVLRERE